MSEYVTNLKKMLEEHRSEANAAPMKAYMKERCDFLGIKSPERKELFRRFWDNYGIPGQGQLRKTVRELYACPEREYHYFAIELAGKYRKDWKPSVVTLFEYIAVTRSWWDTVDHLRGICLKHYFLRFTDKRFEISERWIESGNLWLQRLSVIFQLGYKEKTDTVLLERNISRLTGSKEFFVQKAIGWALRDYARTDPEFVRGLVGRLDLKPLSRREALKHLK